MPTIVTSRRTDEEQLLRGYTGRVFLLLTLVYLAMKTGQRLLSPLLPLIIDDLGITSFVAGVGLSLMAVLRAVLQYPSGRFSDGLSRATILLAAFGLGVTGFVLLVATPTYLVFLAAVCVLGSAIGLFDPAARALISDLFYEKRGRAFGLHSRGRPSRNRGCLYGRGFDGPDLANGVRSLNRCARPRLAPPQGLEPRSSRG